MIATPTIMVLSGTAIGALVVVVVALLLRFLRRRRAVDPVDPSRYTDAVRAEAQQQILEAEALFRTSFDGAPIGMALLTPDGHFMTVNTAFERVVGRTAEELMDLECSVITHPDDLAEDLRLRAETIEGARDSYEVEKRFLRPDGTAVPARMSVSLVRHPSGVARHFVAQVIDLSDQVAASAAAADADDRFSALYEASPLGIAVIEDDVIVKANPAMRRLVADDGVVGLPFTSLFLEEDHVAVRAALMGAGPIDARFAAAADGRVGEVHAAPLIGSDGDRIIAQVLDVSQRIAHEDRLRDLADHDALTGLLNRRRLAEELHVMSADCRAMGITGALLLLDLDGFKLLNDSLGHIAGDAALVAIARTLRAVSGPTATVARLGGDEFAIILPAVTEERAVMSATTIIGALRHRSRHDVTDSPIITASVGIAIVGHDTALSTDDLMARADLAVYDAKDAGRNRVAVYDPSSGRRELVAMRQQWIDRLRSDTEHLVAYAQPIVPTDLRDQTRRIELLVRYRADDGQLIAPGEFLPIAEQTGLVGDIDRWVLQQAVDLIRASPTELHVAVNLSAQTLVDPSLMSVLDDLGVALLPPRSLMVEITETAALSDSGRIAEITAALRARGCELAMDDFGSGFATFGYLQRLDVDLLKIDGGFIHDLATNPTSRLIVESIVSLASKLELPVVAEHVQDPESLRLLIAMGVQYVQGFLFSPPHPVADLLAEWERSGSHRRPLDTAGSADG